MRLAEALADVEIRDSAQFDPELEVDAISIDSRLVRPGAIFAAVPGYKVDGARFIPPRSRSGRAVVADRIPDELAPGVAYLAVDDVRAAIPALARAINGRPDERLTMLGVTGTNGKTTVAYLAAEVLRGLGRRVGVMGTVGFDIEGRVIETPHTTPEAPILHELLRQGVEAGLDTAVLEVSSHSMELHRADGIPFAVTMFTNLTEDHLELHGDMDNYFAAKRRLFECSPASVAVIDVDGPWGARLADEREAAGQRVVRASAGRGPEGLADAADASGAARDSGSAGEQGAPGDSDGAATAGGRNPAGGLPSAVRAERIEMSISGTEFDLVVGEERRRVRLRWLGDYNVGNALVAAGAALALGGELDAVVAGLEQTAPVTGRLEPIANDNDLAIIIDYAHTTDALETCLRAVRALSGDRPITLVHGVLGDRVTELRREMGVIAGRGADHVIFTEDDLKVSSFDDVRADVERGLAAAGGATWEVVENRWAAIGAGVDRARRGDVVVIAGKGHERQLILPDGAGIVHLNEHDAVAEALAGRDPRALDPRESRP